MYAQLDAPSQHSYASDGQGNIVSFEPSEPNEKFSPYLHLDFPTSYRELRHLSSIWTHEQDEELRELFERFKEENG